MKAEKVFCMRQGWHWIAQGPGELRPIIAEGDTRKEAVEGYTKLYSDQYAEAQCKTYYSLMAQGGL